MYPLFPYYTYFSMLENMNASSVTALSATILRDFLILPAYEDVSIIVHDVIYP